MIATTNSRTKEILEILEPSPIAVHPRLAAMREQREAEADAYMRKLGELRERRTDAEQRGDADALEALADEYLAIDALSNYSALMRKVEALRGAL